MKKRLIPCLCLLFALCLACTSCTAGLPGEALYSAIKDSLSSFDVKLENLFAENTPIVLDGKSDYTVQLALTASAELTKAVDDMLSAIQLCTGVTVSRSEGATAAHKILIGETSDEASKDVAEQLNAVNFYVGFVAGDLVIHAKNDIMLISALRYFTEQYLTHADANIGEGYWFLPNTLDHLSPVLECNSKDFKLGRVSREEADRSTNYVINNAYDRIAETTGIKLSVTSYSMSGNALATQQEVILGKVQREETADILSTLEKNQFYIGSNGTKVMVLAPHAAALRQGINTFLATFMESDTAVYDAENKTWLLPSYCHYYHTYQVDFDTP